MPPLVEFHDGDYRHRGCNVSVGFYNGRWARNLISGGVYSSIKLNTGTPTVTLDINRDGSITQTAAGGGTGGLDSGSFSPQWARFIATNMGDAFWVRCVTTGGIFFIGTADTWLALSSSRSFGTQRGSLGSNIANGTIQIATDSGGANIVATFDFTVRAIVTSS